jgi:uncharacterized protein (TIGR00288 family)
METNKKVALFIDCENISHKYMDEILTNLASYGEIHIRKAYGDWKQEGLKHWNDKIFDYSLEPIYQPPYSDKKNATDIRMTVDIMKTLYQTNKIDYIALATSDSDFTPLVTEIKSQGIQVIGFGEKKTNKVLRKACSEFIEMKVKENTPSKFVAHGKFINRVKNTINQIKDDDGWAYVSEFGVYYKNNYGKIAQNYGDYKTWGPLLKDLDDIVETHYFESASGHRKTLMVRIK